MPLFESSAVVTLAEALTANTPPVSAGNVAFLASPPSPVDPSIASTFNRTFRFWLIKREDSLNHNGGSDYVYRS